VSIGAVLTAVAGNLTRLPSAIALAVAAWGIAGGLAIVASVTAPYPLPDRSTNPFTSGGAGTGVQALGSAFGTLFASLALLAPFVIAMLVFPATGWAQVVIGLAAAGAGIGAWRAGFAVAVHRAESRQVEILAALSPRIAG
jgi:ABC-2 type transport system permease protein